MKVAAALLQRNLTNVVIRHEAAGREPPLAGIPAIVAHFNGYMSTLSSWTAVALGKCNDS